MRFRELGQFPLGTHGTEPSRRIIAADQISVRRRTDLWALWVEDADVYAFLGSIALEIS
jgi:hypothetical protein